MNSAQLMRRAEITYRQLDYWTRRGYIRPVGGETAATPGSGHQRNFSEGMMLKARWMGCLVKLGFEVDLAEKLAAAVALQEAKTCYLGHGVTVMLEKHSH
jgi:DNA-binding transcriptional MerR regulator